MSAESLDPVSLIVHAPFLVRVTVGTLAFGAVLAFSLGVAKLILLLRSRQRQRAIEEAALGSTGADDLVQTLRRHRSAPGGNVLTAVLGVPTARIERLHAIADRAVVAERVRATAFTAPLRIVAAAAPLAGLFGAVYAILDAFLRLGVASGPAVGAALIVLALGLFAALPAVAFLRALDALAADLVAEVEASALEWTALIAEHPRTAPLPSTLPTVSLAPARTRPTLPLQSA